MELMWMTTKPLRLTCKTVIVDRGLCVLKGLISMYEIGFYVSAVANKHIYRKEVIYGDKINAHFEEKIVENECHPGNWKGVDLGVFVVKETN